MTAQVILLEIERLMVRSYLVCGRTPAAQNGEFSYCLQRWPSIAEMCQQMRNSKIKAVNFCVTNNTLTVLM